jgi:hypothetical protein
MIFDQNRGSNAPLDNVGRLGRHHRRPGGTFALITRVSPNPWQSFTRTGS